MWFSKHSLLLRCLVISTVITIPSLCNTVPVLIVNPTSYSVTGGGITLQCSIASTSTTVTSVTWQRTVGNTVTTITSTTNTNKYSGSTTTQPSLTIFSTNSGDTGSYVCRATNSAGTGSSQTITLSVITTVPFVQMQQPFYSVTTGGSVTLVCIVSSNLAITNVYWQRNIAGTVTTISSTFNTNKYSGSTTTTPSLTIFNAASSDAGSYQCFGSNSVGTEQSSFATLRVSGNTSSSSCSKTCDIGTRRRNSYDSQGQLLESVEEYCNLQYCPDDWIACNGTTTACYNAFSTSRFQCTNNRCVCTLGTGYNMNNCFPEVGNCIMREEPPTALGFKDPSIVYNYNYKMNSCTTGDNINSEVHVIGVYGDECYSSYKVTVLPSGPVNKQIILILTSYETTHWIIDSAVPLEKVLFYGYTGNVSTVTVAPSSKCDVLSERRSNLTFGYGSDTGGGRTLQLLKGINAEFGTITSFTGYYSLVSRTSIVSNIILKVGGNSLAVTARNNTYDYSSIPCNPPPSTVVSHTESTTHKSTTATDVPTQPLSESWSSCSKSCDIGIRRRQRMDTTGAKLQIEEEYCNLQYCPDDWKSCNCTVALSCYTDGLGSRGKCTNSRCHCTLTGVGYNGNNCYPEVGNCVIRKEPPTAIGFRDPSKTYQSTSALYSCTTDDNTLYEVHMIGIYGNKTSSQYQITVRPRGPVTKQIIIILTSYETTHWKIDSSLNLTVLYGGFHSNTATSTLQQVSSSNCYLNVTKRSDLEFGYGSDTGGGRTLKLLDNIKGEYGPITSFTGYYWLKTSSSTSYIILNVGGYPLSILPNNFTYTQTEHCSATQQTSLPTAQPTSATSTESHTTSFSPTTSTESSSSLPIIVGASVGSSAVTLIIVIIVIIIHKRKQKNDKTDNRPKTQDKDQDEQYDYIDDTHPSHYQELTEKGPPSVYDRLEQPTPIDRTYVYLS